MKMKPAKKIEDLDFYEILGLRKDASAAEIEASHRTAVSIYEPNSLASYGLISGEERRFMLERIDQAYQTLSDPLKRRLYDEENLPQGMIPSPRALFRSSVNPLEIQDADSDPNLLLKVRRFFKTK